MGKDISLTVQMNMPCNENWNGMEPTEQGRFCNKCQKPVVDFTDLSDQQVLQYFLEHPFPVCGRMLTTQRDNNFVHSTSKMNRKLTPVAATLLTVATITAKAAPLSPLAVSMQKAPLKNNQLPNVPADTVSISGTVKNEHGEPIENAEIVFDQYKILSDKNGSFRFTLQSEFNKPTIIQFSYGNLIREVRSYHPLMGSTSYDVTLLAHHRLERFTMGIIRPNIHLADSLPALSFLSSNKLDVKTKAFLINVATKLKDNPGAKITLTAFYKTSKQKATKLCNLIKNYLEAEEGIDVGRIELATPRLLKQIKPEVIIDFTTPEE